ncbi:MAG: hypothetical protein PVI59_14750 [Anaerolineae bacterium]|jgi:uridine phosphorylase
MSVIDQEREERMPSRSFLITPQQTISAARKGGMSDQALTLSGIAVLTFCRDVMAQLRRRCALTEFEWLSSRHHPYAAPHVVQRGKFQHLDVIALVPPMGGSPMACVVEDLVACGIQAVFLVCAAWSVGPPVAFGDIIIPTFSVGRDGTSIHYGNRQGRMEASPRVVEALTAAARDVGVRFHTGGNGTCEALYRITPQMVSRFQSEGCLCLDNGEASTLFALSRAVGVPAGVIFQPYIELPQGWDPERLRDERYRIVSHYQADIALEAGLRLTGLTA